MKKLLLTSTGLSNEKIVHSFFGLIQKAPEDVRIAFVPAAASSPEEMNYVEESREELIRFGVRRENIKDFDLCHTIDYSEIEDCDAMYVCGGNTFNLLAKIRKTNFDVALERFLASGKVYFGVSAGSIVVTPSIEIALVEPGDSNDVGITDFRGLNIVDFEISPHVPEIVSYDNVEKYSKTTKNKIYAIDHNSAILVQDKSVQIIGGGACKIYNETK